MRNKNNNYMDSEIIKNHKIYLDRINLYKKYGYDIEKNRKYIINAVKPLYGKILEVGAGNGYMTLLLSKEGYSFTSIDISKEAQEVARLNVKYFNLEDRVSFRIEDAENMSFSNSIFDVIISVNTIHELNNPFRMVDELIRVLSSKGKIILSDFTKDGYDVISKVLSFEERTYSKRNNIEFEDIIIYFKKRQFVVKNIFNKYQQIFIAIR